MEWHSTYIVADIRWLLRLRREQELQQLRRQIREQQAALESATESLRLQLSQPHVYSSCAELDAAGKSIAELRMELSLRTRQQQQVEEEHFAEKERASVLELKVIVSTLVLGCDHSSAAVCRWCRWRKRFVARPTRHHRQLRSWWLPHSSQHGLRRPTPRCRRRHHPLALSCR
jgi:hypothetical protein